MNSQPENIQQQMPASEPNTIPGKKKKTSSGQTILIPLLAVLTGLLIGAIAIIVTNLDVMAAWKNFFSDPMGAINASLSAVGLAYGSLFTGAFGNPATITAGFSQWFSTGDSTALIKSLYPLTESLTASTPFIIAGLALAIGFIAGLFNIGAEGQFLMGALASAYIGYSIVGLPAYIHLPLAMIAGAVGGAAWAFLPGFLKARVGAHEVVTTIMMNYISYALSSWLLNGPMKAPGYRPLTPVVEDSAMLPRFFSDPLRFNWGFFLALAIAVFVYWLLFKTTLGYEIRAVGYNPNAAKYAGINIVNNTIIVMLISGGLAGLAGATQVLGVDHWVSQGYSSGYGFNSIAVALLGNSNPLGVVFAALLFGFLTSGATRMQSLAGIPISIISVIQGLVIIFVAAPAIIRSLYRIRAAKKGKPSSGHETGKPVPTSESTKP
ncbi:MAG TPA: ABC transporter permease [Longilinea sp.]|nr:ABC transporter permease [Longilinea sp.]